MNYQNRSKQELILELLRVNQELISYKEQVKVETIDVKHLKFELGERRKELDCHNGMTQLFLNKNLSMDEVLKEVVLLYLLQYQENHFLIFQFDF
jgi:hypothetical protein